MKDRIKMLSLFLSTTKIIAILLVLLKCSFVNNLNLQSFFCAMVSTTACAAHCNNDNKKALVLRTVKTHVNSLPLILMIMWFSPWIGQLKMQKKCVCAFVCIKEDVYSHIIFICIILNIFFLCCSHFTNLTIQHNIITTRHETIRKQKREASNGCESQVLYCPESIRARRQRQRNGK